MRSVRLLVVFFILLTIVAELTLGGFPRFALSAFGFFVMFELFFRFHIERVSPSVLASDNTVDPLLSATKDAFALYVASPTTSILLQALLQRPVVRYVLAKLSIAPKEIVSSDMTKEALYKEALHLCQKTGGMYVTTLDIIIAYLLYTESQRRLLFSKEIKPDSLVSFLTYVRHATDKDEIQEPLRVHFSGEGIGEALVTGWTPLTQQFTTDWTQKALSQKRLITGRAKEYTLIREALSKKENNNIVLVGEPGVGKDELLVALVHDSFMGVLPHGLNHKRLLALSVGALLAGAQNQGELEERVNAIIAEVRHAGNVILYIPEFQDVLGSSQYRFSLAGSLMPYLRDGRLPIVATMTRGNFKQYLENNGLMESFNAIHIEPPDTSVALDMLTEKSVVLERQYHCILSYQAIMAAVHFAPKFLPDEVLPGSGVKLLAAAANAAVEKRGKRTLISANDIQREVEKKTNIAVGTPGQEEKDLLLHLEDKIHERVINQAEAVSAIAEAMRRIRSGLAPVNKPISFLFLGPTGVGKTETAKALSALYFKGEDHMIRLDMSEYADDQGVRRLLGSSPGEGNERGELPEKIHDHPYSLVLLDEFEKANHVIQDLFLQVLDDGRLTDNKGKTVSFANCVIIATSNAASEFIREEIAKGMQVDKVFHQALLEHLQSRAIFKPELLNRFDEIITFTPLNDLEIRNVVVLLLKKLTAKLTEQDISLTVSDDVAVKIAEEGYDKQFGARPIKRFIQDRIEDQIARLKLEDKLPRGSKASVTLDGERNIVVAVAQ